ncbi:unnamed protein product [Sordaria macrospora k-hell]|uniref:WGS project CABT00000000 data, contig 2.3 n=1 Tax=Sordaria macrospora (strain ATCC MYA-333 / DSM 997 / K(L3346) / K-hell) TaxID=771870 RepID=F7VPE4_SORMK|nr:uncharacterized protein SMAC_02380 [Sordaria macrospora k-hell]CCC07372.1 unnamed protein product [Sordaria macrospora k-hell]
MGFNILLPIRVLQATFSIIIIGLSGFVAHWYNANTTYLPPSQISFLLFCGVYSLLSILYLGLISKLFPKTSNPYAVLSLEITNLLFWFAGFVSLSTFLSKLLFCRGSVCGAARADVGMAACLSVSWTVTMALLARDAIRSGGFEGFRGEHRFPEAQAKWQRKSVGFDGGNGGHVGQTSYAPSDGHDDEEGGWVFPGVAGLKGLVVVARLHEHEKEKKRMKIRGYRITPSMEVVKKKVVGAWDRRGMEVSFLPV